MKLLLEKSVIGAVVFIVLNGLIYLLIRHGSSAGFEFAFGLFVLEVVLLVNIKNHGAEK
jgi:FtsH-binding integral membrane protein